MLGRRFGDLYGLAGERLKRQPAPCLDRAEPAASRADITQDHKCSRAARKAIIPIRAAGLLADRMKPASSKHLLQPVIGLDVADRLSEPLRKSRPRLAL